MGALPPIPILRRWAYAAATVASVLIASVASVRVAIEPSVAVASALSTALFARLKLAGMGILPRSWFIRRPSRDERPIRTSGPRRDLVVEVQTGSEGGTNRAPDADVQTPDLREESEGSALGVGVERTGIEPVTSGLQTRPIAQPHLTPTYRIGMTEPKSALSSNVI